MVDILIATKNSHKARELKTLLRVRGIRWHSLAEFPDVPSVVEDGRTFETNAAKKAKVMAGATGLLALADDSGIEVQALGWGPGVKSARFARRHGNDQANNAKLLRLLTGLPMAKRRARYRCVLVLADSRRVLAQTTGTWSGRIAFAPAGRTGFGYDPLFLVPGTGKTVGQLPAAAKRRLSHRAAAAQPMRTLLRRFVQRTVSGRTGSGAGRAGRARVV